MKQWHKLIKYYLFSPYFFFLFFLFLFIYFNFILFFKLYIIVLVLPNIKMNPPQVYMCFLFPKWDPILIFIMLVIGLYVTVSCSVMPDSLQPHGLYSLPCSSAHGILQAKILEWVAISFSSIFFVDILFILLSQADL